MNIKQAIEIVKDKVKRGEKFEAMWEEYKKMKPVSYEGDYTKLPFPFVSNYIVMGRLEQKYFPK